MIKALTIALIAIGCQAIELSTGTKEEVMKSSEVEEQSDDLDQATEKTCPEKSTFSPEKNRCLCDEKGHRMLYGTCVLRCPWGARREEGKCVCNGENKVYDDKNEKCVCDEGFKSWWGMCVKAGSSPL